MLIEATGVDLPKQVDTRKNNQRKNKYHDQLRQTYVPTRLFAQKVEAHRKGYYENQQEAKKDDDQSLSIHFGTSFGNDFQEHENRKAPKRKVRDPFSNFGSS